MTNEGEIFKVADIRRKPIRDKVMPCIAAICERYDAGIDQYDAYYSLAKGESSLYLNDDGFLVLRQDQDRHTKERVLFVWFAQAFKRGQHFITSSYHDWLINLGYSINADRIEFCAPREGYEKALPQGWKKTITTYEWVLK